MGWMESASFQNFVWPSLTERVALWPNFRKEANLALPHCCAKLRNVARPLRLEFPGALYHLMARDMAEPIYIWAMGTGKLS